MMNSLFSTFDPLTFKLQLNWMMMMMPLLLLPMNFWLKNSRISVMKYLLETKMINEMKNITHHKEIMIISISLFLMIMIMNISGLMPYIFTSTSHISFNLSIALPMWLSLLMYGWLNSTSNMLCNLLPKGTPMLIMPMMIIIEIIGNLIRPISLSVRLTANMIAGHLMMTLLGNLNELNIVLFILPMQMMIMSFELAISTIQAYVFMTLMTLYSSEIPYE